MGLLQDRQSARIARRVHVSVSTFAFACFLGAAGAADAQPQPQQQPQPLYQTVVHAPPYDAPLDDAAADASVVTDRRTPRAGESVPQLLAELPGVTINRMGGTGSLALVSLRGSTWDQVGVYVDGIPLNSAQGGGVDVSTLPLGDVERIEVYRGSSPIAFGSSALGGIISITTRAPRVSYVDLEVGSGSFETNAAGASASWVGARARVYTGMHLLQTAGDFWFTSDNGTAFDTSHDHEVRRSNDAATQADGTARVVVPLGDERDLSAFALAFFRDQGLPGYGSVRQTQQTSLRTLRLVSSLAYTSRVDVGPGSLLRAQAYYMRGQQRFTDPLAEVAIAPAATNDVTHSVGGSAHIMRPFGSWLRASAVTELRYDRFQPFDADATPPAGDPATRLFGAAGLEFDAWWQRARLHVIPSARLELAHDTRSGRGDYGQLLPDGTPISNVIPSLRLGLLERPRESLALRGNLARYGRLPSALDLYGNSGFVRGNPALVPESGWNADLGANWRLKTGALALTFDAALFASKAEDLIQFQQDAYGRAHAINVGRARILGGEASVEARAAAWGRLLVDGTFIDARDVSATSLGAHAPLLPNRPRFHVYGRPELRRRVSGDLTVGAYADVDVVDGNYLDPANLVLLPPRVLVGAGLFAEATSAHLMIVASAQNLGDARSFDFAGFPLPSRSLFITARITSPKETSP